MSQISIANSISRTLQADVTITGVVRSGSHIQYTGTHHYQAGDLVAVSGILGTIEANLSGVVSSVSGTAGFTLEVPVLNLQTLNVYVSGGVSKHLGFVSPTANIDNTQIDQSSIPPADYTLRVRMENLSAGATCRIVLQDALDPLFQTGQPVAQFSFAGFTKNSVSDSSQSKRAYSIPDTRIGTSGCVMRA